jgi:hypothetical protein
MHGAKATTAIVCGSNREVLDGLIQAISRTNSCWGDLRALRKLWAVSVRPSCGWVGIDRFCLNRADAENDGGRTGRGGPLDRGASRSACDCTSHVGRPTLHALRAPSGPRRRGDLYWLLGSAPDGIAQRAQGRVRIDNQEWEAGGGDRSIRVVDWERCEGVGGGRQGQVWVVVVGDQVDLSVGSSALMRCCP